MAVPLRSPFRGAGSYQPSPVSPYLNEEMVERIRARRAAMMQEEAEEPFDDVPEHPPLRGGAPPPPPRAPGPFTPIPPPRMPRFEINPQTAVYDEGLPPARQSTFEYIQPSLAQREAYTYRQEDLPAQSQATASSVGLKRPRHVVFDHPARVEVWESVMAGPRRPPKPRARKTKAAPRKAVKTAISRAVPPVVVKTPLHPLVSRIKYGLERKVLGLANQINKVRNMKGSRKYTNRDGSTRMQAIKTPTGGVAVIPLRAAQERKLMGKLGSVLYDAQGLGFADYLINKVDIPPAQYGRKAQKIDQYGSRVLQLNPKSL